ncbi:Peptidase, M48 family [uncultured Desulfatiglans sp.]|uniref:Peptidase, M48 family n=1 Tax=Uncultured Desulfatiglans sp. TaxID=1748965 RepID=A0A653A0Z8_UNCDX|nr:Peptidase, M48 family [uncultured Desulfatiglans sp.]
MNPYLAFVLVVLIGSCCLDLLVERLNLKSLEASLPEEFAAYYDEDGYRRSQAYLRANARLEMVSEPLLTVLIIGFILFGGFNQVDALARSFGVGPIWTGLIFAGLLLLARELVDIPLSAYQTFVIEETFGFNRTIVRIFFQDLLKGWALAILIGGPVFASVLWFFDHAGAWAWIWCWGVVTAFQLLLLFVAPVLILPLFNRFEPLPEGPLRNAILDYAKSQQFKLKGVFTMDASRRSTKSNAFFVGFGRYKRVVLFDTLISRLNEEEIVAILAHEIGHHQQHHTLKTLLLSIFTTGLMLALLSLFIGNQRLFEAFRMEQTSTYAAFFFFGLLYTPLSMLLGIVGNILSRRFEFAADAFAVKTSTRPLALIEALKKLTVENLSNLTPHPLKVFLDYSHPPVLDRVRAIRETVHAPIGTPGVSLP